MLLAEMMTHPAQFSRGTVACITVEMLLQHFVTVTGSASTLLAFKADPLFTLRRENGSIARGNNQPLSFGVQTDSWWRRTVGVNKEEMSKTTVFKAFSAELYCTEMLMQCVWGRAVSLILPRLLFPSVTGCLRDRERGRQSFAKGHASRLYINSPLHHASTFSFWYCYASFLVCCRDVRNTSLFIIWRPLVYVRLFACVHVQTVMRIVAADTVM